MPEKGEGVGQCRGESGIELASEISMRDRIEARMCISCAYISMCAFAELRKQGR